MARNSEEESCKGSEQEEGEDEALSLSDLPLNFINEETSLQCSKEATPVKENEEEFNFDSWGGSLSVESEMCAADEVFFKGQMLPLRLSVSSDSGLVLARFQNDSRNISNSRCVSRSESMDRRSSSMGGLTSINSSRVSSTKSHYSSSSGSSNSCITNTTRNSRAKIRNQFHSFPSPKPQIRVSNARLLGNGSRSQKSTVWDFFRLGLVRAPEIELHDLKVRNNINSSVSRNSSSGSSSTNSSSSGIAAKNQQDLKLDKHQKKQSFLEKRKGWLFSGCKFSIAAVETVPLHNIVVIKSKADHESSSSNNYNHESNSSAVQGMEKKLQDLKINKKIKEKHQGKQAMSHHRTCEWLKELSHASYVDGNLLV